MTAEALEATNGSRRAGGTYDVVVVGAGFSGLYLLHRLRTLGLSVRVLESADDVGGTWYWNRYPGARCDIPTTDYTYSFDPALEEEWTWSEKYATQPEILSYLQFVTERYGLREDISFSTGVASAAWDEAARLWRLRTSAGDELSCRFYVMATGCLSMPKEIDIEGADRFRGEVYFTSRWPHEGVDFTGKRVAVIGTGSSGIQSIPLIAQQAAELTVFQRTPNFSFPARNGPAGADALEALREDRPGYRAAAKLSRGGIPDATPPPPAALLTPEQQRERLEAAWEAGALFAILGVFADQMFDPATNDIVAEFVREKIRSIVTDPETAEALCPRDHPIGTKRPCLDTDYYATFNLPHVRLVDLRKTPITGVTETGIDTVGESFDFDAIVYATGFDAMTGALVGVDITGRGGLTLRQKWADGPVTYLGLMTVGFPNLFMITGPGSPSVLSNMAVSIEQHADWVADRIEDLRTRGIESIEPTHTAEAGWVQHVNDCADITLYPTANSWYMGANVPGKPRVFLPYIGGVGPYRQACDRVVDQDYLGFALEGPGGRRCNDGVVNRLQPDVALVLETMAQLELPPLESMTPDQARMFMEQSAAVRPPGPEVAEIVDGILPGAAGELAYRLFRPEGAGPHPVVLYFHGGGWVLGDQASDEPLCRDLCVRTGAVVISVNYRHAPEHPFPAPVDDAWAALQWVAANTIELGGIPGQLLVAGWSAGANLATVAARMARDEGGPALVGQLLVCPVTDSDLTRPSYVENAEGYGLTVGLMRWFWDHYTAGADRTDPRMAPLRSPDLTGLAPTVLVACEFDPLRDEGLAYGSALEKAGVPVRQIWGRGHTHVSLSMVGVVLSGARIREELAEAVQDLLASPVRA